MMRKPEHRLILHVVGLLALAYLALDVLDHGSFWWWLNLAGLPLILYVFVVDWREYRRQDGDHA